MRAFIIFVLAGCTIAAAQSSETPKGESVLRQYYSAKIGYYRPTEGLNDGLLLGVDGITEFVKYGLNINGAIDLYQKQTFNFFTDPKPNIQQQALVLLPLHANIGYTAANVPDAELRLLFGAGAGYYLYFYAVEYRQSSGGGIFNPASLTTTTENKNGGDLFGTAYIRLLFGKVFVEPRWYFAAATEETIGSHRFVLDPSGFAVTIGFQQ